MHVHSPLCPSADRCPVGTTVPAAAVAPGTPGLPVSRYHSTVSLLRRAPVRSRLLTLQGPQLTPAPCGSDYCLARAAVKLRVRSPPTVQTFARATAVPGGAASL